MSYLTKISVEGTEYQIKDSEAVHFTEQTLTDEQQAQARENIGAASEDEVARELNAVDSWQNSGVKTYAPSLTKIALMNGTGKEYVSEKRVTTSFIPFYGDKVYVNIPDGLRCMRFYYNEEGAFITNGSWTTKRIIVEKLSTFSKGYFRLMFSNTADDNTITVDDVKSASYYSDTFYSKSLKGQPLADMMYSWWVYPLAYEFNNNYDHLYLGWTNNTGGKGVAQYNPQNGGVVSANFGTSEVDDHSATSVCVLPDGKLLSAYSAHNEDDKVRVKISSTDEDARFWEDATEITVPANATYSQLVRLNNKIYLFYRCEGTLAWFYSTSVNGVDWTEPIRFITSSAQSYILVRNTTDSKKAHIAFTVNPSATPNSANIRGCLFDASEDKFYSLDGSEITSTVSNHVSENINGLWWTDISVIISRTVNGVEKTNRLLDLAITEPFVIKILVARFTDETDITYHLFDGTNLIDICNAGAPFYTSSKYCGGASFNPTDEKEIYISRENDGKWYIEKWKNTEGVLNKEKTMFTSKRDNVAIRPIVSTEGRFLVFVYGAYNPDDFSDFDTQIKILPI